MGSQAIGSRRRTIAAATATIGTSIGLYPVFSGGGWFWAGAGAAASIAGAGTLTRTRRLPVAVCLLGGLAGLLLYLNLVFAHGQSLAALVPTPSSLGYLGSLAGQGLRESARYSPPVPELNGMVLLTAGGIGLTALLVDLIAVRLGSAALAGLPLLLLFAEPFTLSVNRGWLGTTTVFCLAAAGYLTLLGTEGRERIRAWERPPSGHARPAGHVPSGRDVPGAALPGEALPGAALPGAADGLRPPDTRALAAAGRRVGIASVVAALCVPLFVPGMHVTRLFGSGSPGTGGIGGGIGGVGNIGFPDPQTQISGELRSTSAVPVLSYTATVQDPGYLQVYVLGDLTAHGWAFSRPQSLVPVSAGIPAPPGLASQPQGESGAPTAASSSSLSISAGVATDLVTTRIAISKKAGQDALVALPAPYPPVRVDGGGSPQADRDTLMLFDTGGRLAGLDYSVQSLDIVPSAQALASAAPPPKDITGRYLGVPRSYASLRTLAEGITANATTPYAKAVALQNWFADGNFGYSLSAPTITNAAGLETFVVSTRSGYCQQFSFAMAVLARLIGIPSRVVYGFTQGTRQPGGGWRVTTHDAHAWPELYFQGAGWLRFEPTPGGSGGQGTATTPAYTVPQTGSGSSTPTTPLPNPSGQTGGTTGNSTGQAAQNRDRQLLAEGGYGGSAVPAAPLGGMNPWELAGLSALGLLLVAAVAPGCARAVVRRRRWWRARLLAGRAHTEGEAGTEGGARDAIGDMALAAAAWRELRDDLTDYRVGLAPSESPRAVARRITGELQLPADAADALRRVTMAAERARYSSRPASGTTLRRDSVAVRRAIAASVPRRTRWLARAFPSSVTMPAVSALGRVTDVFGRLGSGRAKTSTAWIRTGRLRGRTAP